MPSGCAVTHDRLLSSPRMQLWLALLIAFLVGGIPFGFLAVRWLRGQDVRLMGSGNIGATNAARCFPGIWRWVAFLGIYVLDFLKGYLPVVLLAPEVTTQATWVGPALAATTVLGHCFTPYLKFKGGKGVATGGGAFFALEPLAVAIAIGVFFVVLGIARMTAIGSMALGFALAIVVVFRDLDTAFGARVWTSGLAIALAFFLVWTHRSNIRQMMRLYRQKRSGIGAQEQSS